jgi:hypothetical protein
MLHCVLLPQWQSGHHVLGYGTGATAKTKPATESSCKDFIATCSDPQSAVRNALHHTEVPHMSGHARWHL